MTFVPSSARIVKSSRAPFGSPGTVAPNVPSPAAPSPWAPSSNIGVEL